MSSAFQVSGPAFASVKPALGFGLSGGFGSVRLQERNLLSNELSKKILNKIKYCFGARFKDMCFQPVLGIPTTFEMCGNTALIIKYSLSYKKSRSFCALLLINLDKLVSSSFHRRFQIFTRKERLNGSGP